MTTFPQENEYFGEEAGNESIKANVSLARVENDKRRQAERWRWLSRFKWWPFVCRHELENCNWN